MAVNRTNAGNAVGFEGVSRQQRARQQKKEDLTSIAGSTLSDGDGAVQRKPRTSIQDEVGRIYKLQRQKNGGKASDGSASPSPSDAEAPSPASKPAESSDDNLKSLAQRYVDQYSRQSGRSLSEADRESLTNAVFDFYSAPSRAGRLEKIVIDGVNATA